MSADWTAIRNDYINGLGSAAELAKRYGVKAATIRSRAMREKWNKAAQQQCNTIATLCNEKIAEAVANAEAERASILSGISTKAAVFLDQRLDNLIGTGAKAYEIKAIMETVKIIRELDKETSIAEDDPLKKYMEEMRNA